MFLLFFMEKPRITSFLSRGKNACDKYLVKSKTGNNTVYLQHGSVGYEDVHIREH